jgi:hypothetical protein
MGGRGRLGAGPTFDDQAPAPELRQQRRLDQANGAGAHDEEGNVDA